MFDVAYVAVLLGSMIALAIFWRMLPWLIVKQITRDDSLNDARLRPARASNARIGPVLPQTRRHVVP